MSRFLFVVAPLAGHIHPATAVAQVLQADGHEVAWVGSETYLRPLVGTDRVFPSGLRPYRGQHDRGARAMKSVWDEFMVPFARAILPAVEKAAAAFAPDVLVADQSALAGAVVAHQHGLRWATICPQAMELTQPFRERPRVDAWIRDRLAGLAPGASVDLRFSPHLVVAFTGTALTGPVAFPEHFVLVGPAIGERPPVPGFPWAQLDPDRQLVLVSMGTLAQDLAADFYGRAAEALRGLRGRVQAVLVAPDGAVPEQPGGGLIVRPRVPVPQLLPRLSAVVCHAGLNITCESLAHGIPVVVAPIRHDQPIIAEQVVRAGAGARVRFGRATPDQLRTAVTTVLDQTSYRVAAGHVRDSFAAAGGARAAAAHLVRLAQQRPAPPGPGRGGAAVSPT